MNPRAKLTRRELEVAELLAWGASKKQVAIHLFISIRTVENHTRNIFEKTGCKSVSELSAWWFCTEYNIPFSLSPLARTRLTVMLLCSFFIGEYAQNSEFYRRVQRTEESVVRRIRRREETAFRCFNFFDYSA